MEAQELCGGEAASLQPRADHRVVAGEGAGRGCLRQRVHDFPVVLPHPLVVSLTLGHHSFHHNRLRLCVQVGVGGGLDCATVCFTTLQLAGCLVNRGLRRLADADGVTWLNANGCQRLAILAVSLVAEDAAPETLLRFDLGHSRGERHIYLQGLLARLADENLEGILGSHVVLSPVKGIEPDAVKEE